MAKRVKLGFCPGDETLYLLGDARSEKGKAGRIDCDYTIRVELISVEFDAEFIMLILSGIRDK